MSTSGLYNLKQHTAVDTSYKSEHNKAESNLAS